MVPNNYKTKRCRHFDSGKCKLGGLCNFAHGDEELRQFKRQDSVRTDVLTPLDKLPNINLQNSTQKIKFMEACLENFHAHQKNILEQLKFLTLSLNAPGNANSDEQVTCIENNIINIYNEAVNYVHTVNKVMDIGVGDTKCSMAEVLNDNPLSPISSKKNSKTEKEYSSLSEILDNGEEFKSMKVQMEFILTQLRKLYSSASSLTSRKAAQLFAPVLDKAEDALGNNKVVEASQWLQQVLYDPSLTQKLRNAHQKIVIAAKSIEKS